MTQPQAQQTNRKAYYLVEGTKLLFIHINRDVAEQERQMINNNYRLLGIDTRAEVLDYLPAECFKG